MNDRPNIETLLKLPADQRLALIEALWDSLASDPVSMPIPDWHLDILKQRMADDDDTLDDGASWDDVRAGIERL